MQSVLYMWCGYLLNWKKYYFILDDNSILFCNKKGGEIQGKISLQLINIHVPIDNPVCFNIHTGMDVMYLKALSIQDKVRWVKKINTIIKNRQKSGIGKLKQQIGYKSRKQQVLRRFEDFVKQLWISHAKLQGAIENFSEKHLKTNPISSYSNLMDEVRRSAASFKFKATQISKYLEQIFKYLKQQNTKLKNPKFISSIAGDSDDEFIDNNDTQFLSFTQDQSPRKYNPKKRSQISNINKQNTFSTGIKKPFTYIQKDADHKLNDLSEYQATPIRTLYISENPIKKTLFQKNEVFLKVSKDLTNRKERQSLPEKFTLEQKFPVMSTLSGALGQNLTKVSFPVTVNEPLSMLQRGCQQLYYSDLLKSADKAKDPIQKMSNIAGFIVSMYSLNEGRFKKPFNPLLGETFFYYDKQRQFFYFSEQVSHHPPISAMYCRSENFEYVGNSSSDLSFTGKSLKLIPSTKSYIVLNGHGDKYWFNKSTVSINNILFGNIYIQITGQIQIICETYKTKATLTFNQKSWRKQQCSVEGKIYQNQKQQSTLFGYWNKQLNIRDSNGKQKTIWSKNHTQIIDQYNFNMYTLQLNHLPLSLIKQLPPTDSRFRPDQRILQYRDIDLAARQKLHLQQKQRQVRKQNQQSKNQHRIVWFQQITQNNQKVYLFLNDKYENQRFRDDKWIESKDLFN